MRDPIAAVGRNIAANGIRQHVLEYRSGAERRPTLVLLPGITSPAAVWGFVAERLAKAFDVTVVDVRGRGLSSSGPGLDHGLDAMADDLSALVAALGCGDVTVLGHSMGARIAIRAAARNPAGLTQLVLVDPPVSGPGRRPYPADLAWYVDSIRLATQGTDAAGLRPFFPTWTKAQLALRAEWLHTCDEHAVVTAFEGFGTDDIHADLPGLSVPAVLMVAGRGGVILPEDEAEICTLNPAIRIARVEMAGHMIPWDDFEGFFGALDHLIGTKLAGDQPNTQP